MEATIKKMCYDYDGEYCREIQAELSQEDLPKLLALTPSYLREYLRESCVGKTTSLGIDKFAPRLEVCGFSVSMQIHYYVWSLRWDRFKSDDELIHHEPTTAEEFDTVLPSFDTYIDVQIHYGKTELTTGQMTLTQISEFFRCLATNLEASISTY